MRINKQLCMATEPPSRASTMSRAAKLWNNPDFPPGVHKLETHEYWPLPLLFKHIPTRQSQTLGQAPGNANTEQEKIKSSTHLAAPSSVTTSGPSPLHLTSTMSSSASCAARPLPSAPARQALSAWLYESTSGATPSSSICRCGCGCGAGEGVRDKAGARHCRICCMLAGIGVFFFLEHNNAARYADRRLRSRCATGSAGANIRSVLPACLACRSLDCRNLSTPAEHKSLLDHAGRHASTAAVPQARDKNKQTLPRPRG